MLNVFRDNLKSFKWVMWVVAIAMVLSLGYYFQAGSSAAATWAVKVNGEQVSFNMFRYAAANLEGNWKQQFGDAYEQLKANLPLGSTTANQLVSQRLIVQDARRLGLGATPDEIAGEIRAQFGDVEVDDYRDFLQRQFRLNVRDFEENIEETLLARKWFSTVTASVDVSEAELKQLYLERNERTTIDYLVVPAAAQDVPQQVDQAALEAWYSEHADEFEKDARRKVRFVNVDRNRVAADPEVTADEVQAYYDANSANYTRAAQRQARHILLRTEPGADEAAKQTVRTQASEVLQRILDGEDFDALARSLSQDPVSAARGGDLGYFGTGDMVPEFDAAVFGGNVGEVVPRVIETQFGFHIIEITGERPAGLTPLAEVEPAIRSSLRLRKAQELADAEAARVADALATADDFSAAAGAEGYQVQSATVTRGERPAGIGGGVELTEEIFAAEVGRVSAPRSVALGSMIYVVDEEIPAGIAPLAEVEDEVRSGVLNERAQAAAIAEAESAFDMDRPISEIAEALSQELRDSGAVSRNQSLPGAGGISEDLRVSLFGDNVAIGDRGVVEVPAGALVYEVTDRQGWDESGFLAARPQLEAELADRRRNELVDALIARLREESSVQTNADLIARFDEAAR